MSLPFRHLHGNIMIGNSEQHAAIYRVATVSYPYLPEADKLAWLGKLARFAYSIGVDFSLYRVCRAYPSTR